MRRRSTTHVVLHTSASAIEARTRTAIAPRFRDAAWEAADGKWVVTLDPTVEDVDGMHHQAGYGGIGYHWYIRKNGTLYAGKAEGLIGAHCSAQRMNHLAIGVCFAGHHNYEPWTPEQRKTWLSLAQRLFKDHAGLAASRVIGHRETGARKDCPGLMIDMAAVRAELARYLRADTTGMASVLLGLGSQGEAVRRIQAQLAGLGHYTGRIDGDFGPLTDGAVRAFQSVAGLIPDGLVGDHTRGALARLVVA